MSTAPASATAASPATSLLGAGAGTGAGPADRRLPGSKGAQAFVSALATLLAPDAGPAGATPAGQARPPGPAPGAAGDRTDQGDGAKDGATPAAGSLVAAGLPAAALAVTAVAVTAGAVTAQPASGAPAPSPSVAAGQPAASAGPLTALGVPPAHAGTPQPGIATLPGATTEPSRMPSRGSSATSPSSAGALAGKAAAADPSVVARPVTAGAAVPLGNPSPSTHAGASPEPLDRPGDTPDGPASPPAAGREALPTGPQTAFPGLLTVSGPEAPPPAASPPPPGPPQAFAAQLGRPVLQLAAGESGEHVLTVRVSPEHLGPVTVQARIGSDGVHIELFSPTDAGRAAVHAALPDLRRELAGAGLGASLDLSDRGAPGQGTPGQGTPGQGTPGQGGSAAGHAGPGGGGGQGRGSGPPESRWPTTSAAPGDALWQPPGSAHRAYDSITALDVLA